MFGIGMPELILILVVALVVVGPRKLPEMARSLGKAMGEFKKATGEMNRAINFDDNFKKPFQEVKEEVESVKEGASSRAASENAGRQDNAEMPVAPEENFDQETVVREKSADDSNEPDDPLTSFHP